MSPTDDQLRALTDYQLRSRADRLLRRLYNRPEGPRKKALRQVKQSICWKLPLRSWDLAVPRMVFDRTLLLGDAAFAPDPTPRQARQRRRLMLSLLVKRFEPPPAILILSRQVGMRTADAGEPARNARANAREPFTIQLTSRP
jgi:hypothetical protein